MIKRAALYGRAFWIRTGLVALIDAFAIIGVIRFAENSSWAVLALLVISTLLINWAYLNPRAQASRWLTPGLVLMMVFVLYPVLYTTYVSFTNFQTGFLLTKDQAIERLEEVSIRTDESGQLLDMAVYRNDANELGLLLTGEGFEPYLGTPRARDAEPILSPAADASQVDPAAPPDAIDGYTLLSGLAITGEASRLDGAVVDLPNGTAEVETFSSARLVVAARPAMPPPSR